MIKIDNIYNEFTNTTNSLWIDTSPETEYPTLTEDITVDVAIVGGGIVGITSAFLLNKEGLKVAVIEADRILHGTTGHSTAKITSQHSLIYAKLQKEMGKELAHQYAQANESAIHLIASTAAEHNIDCDFMWRPAYVYTQADNSVKSIEDEAKAASEFGIKASFHQEAPLPFPTKAAVRFDKQAQFHPLKYLKALASQIHGDKNYIFEKTVAVNLENNPTAVVTRNGKKVYASRIIIASHYPFFDGGAMYFTKIYTDKSYVLAIRASEQFPDGMFISAESPGRSLRSQNDNNEELILVAGEHHKTGDDTNTNIHYQNLLNFAHSSFEVKEVLYRWSTQDCMTIDGIPYVGNLTPRSPDIYVATGFGKWGISNGTASAMILSDLITKGDNPWAPVYNPSRFNLSSVKTFVIQNLDVAKELISGKLAVLPETTDIPIGEAKAVEIDGKNMGAYRDEEGELHLIDRTCTHLGCELVWNDAERSWDCPCHGSRFSYDGDVIEGPAFNHLQPSGQGHNHVEARVFS